MNNLSTTSKNAKKEENKQISHQDSKTDKGDNSQSKPTSKEKKTSNLISFQRENEKKNFFDKKSQNNFQSINFKNNNINSYNINENKINSYNSYNATNNKSLGKNGFSTTKSDNLTFIKKQILSPIKETPVKLNQLKLKNNNEKYLIETTKNLRNKTFSKIVLNPIIDNSSINNNNNNNHNSINKSTFSVNSNYNTYLKNKVNQRPNKDESSVIMEEANKTKESDIFNMTQYDEKSETKIRLKKTTDYNNNNNSINTDSSASERVNKSQIKFFSKLNSNRIISNNINNNNNTNNMFKKLQINTFNKNYNNAIDMKSMKSIDNNNTNDSFSPEASTKYITINQSATINKNFSNNNTFINNNLLSTNIFNKENNNDDHNNNNENNTTTLKKKGNSTQMESFQQNSNISLYNANPEKAEGNKLLEKISQKFHSKEESKYPLIPNSNSRLKFTDSNPLKTIFFSCSDNLNITNKLFNYIDKQKNKKLKSKTVEKLKKKEREFYFEKDLKVDMAFKDKVFVYGENGGYYVSADFGHMQKYNLISKISNNMAMNNRNYLTMQFDYDYKADEDYIYQSELREKYLEKIKEEKEKEQILGDDKHKIVDCYLDNTLKKSEILVQRIDNDLLRYEKEKIRFKDDNSEDNKDGKDAKGKKNAWKNIKKQPKKKKQNDD